MLLRTASLFHFSRQQCLVLFDFLLFKKKKKAVFCDIYIAVPRLQ